MKVRLENIVTPEQPKEMRTERDWPTVPRVGEYIEVKVDGERYTGTVRIVMWGDEGVPLVRFR